MPEEPMDTEVGSIYLRYSFGHVRISDRNQTIHIEQCEVVPRDVDHLRDLAAESLHRQAKLLANTYEQISGRKFSHKEPQ